MNIYLFMKGDNVHQYNTHYTRKLHIPQCRLAWSLKCFPVASMTFYNSLPRDIQSLDATKFKSIVWLKLLNQLIYSYTELDNEPLFFLLSPSCQSILFC